MRKVMQTSQRTRRLKIFITDKRRT
uniref:Uncharacterized protein n=1 Tax=Strigamia maritima TaxID=126957 RepID=T1JFL5_STRMM